MKSPQRRFIDQEQYKSLVDLSWSLQGSERARLTDDDIAYLTQLPTQHINTLYLSRNKLSCMSALHIGRVKWNGLMTLDLTRWPKWNGIWNGLHVLDERGEFMPKSKVVEGIGSMGCKYLIRAFMPRLKSLKLEWNRIDNEGMMHLSKSNWPSLKSINLVNNNIKNPQVMLTKNNWRKLQSIDLRNNTYQRDYRYHKLILNEQPCLKSIKANIIRTIS